MRPVIGCCGRVLLPCRAMSCFASRARGCGRRTVAIARARHRLPPGSPADAKEDYPTTRTSGSPPPPASPYSPTPLRPAGTARPSLQNLHVLVRRWSPKEWRLRTPSSTFRSYHRRSGRTVAWPDDRSGRSPKASLTSPKPRVFFHPNSQKACSSTVSPQCFDRSAISLWCSTLSSSHSCAARLPSFGSGSVTTLVATGTKSAQPRLHR